MARLKSRTTARYFEKGKYVKDGLYCWTKNGTDFECKIECPYNERKTECDCHTAVSKDALEYINELEAKLADVVPKSEVDLYKRLNDELEDELPPLMTNLKKQRPRLREIFEEIERLAMSKIDANLSVAVLNDTYYIEAIDELKKKYTER